MFETSMIPKIKNKVHGLRFVSGCQAENGEMMKSQG